MSITPDHHPKECVCGGTGRVSSTGQAVTNPFDQIPCGKEWPNLDPNAKSEALGQLFVAEGHYIVHEAIRGALKYPGINGMFLSLLQEAGELATQLRSGNASAARDEARQVAALALRISVQGDADGREAFDPLREIVERDKRIETLTALVHEAKEAIRLLARMSKPSLDENDCPMPTCPGCGAYHELVRPGKTQPTCLCDAYQHEVDQHRETKYSLEIARSEKNRIAVEVRQEWMAIAEEQKKRADAAEAEVKRLQGVEVKPTDRLCSVIEGGQTLYELLGNGTVYYHSGMNRDQLYTMIQHVSKSLHSEILFRAKKP